MATGRPLPGCTGETSPWMVCYKKLNFDCKDGMLKVCGDPVEPSADVNQSGFVDIVDFAILVRQWLTTGPQ